MWHEHCLEQDSLFPPLSPIISYSLFFCSAARLFFAGPHMQTPLRHAAIRFSPSKRTRNSIPTLRSASQEILSSQADERNGEDGRDRLGGACSLASLNGQGIQNSRWRLLQEIFFWPWQLVAYFHLVSNECVVAFTVVPWLLLWLMMSPTPHLIAPSGNLNLGLMNEW